MRIPAEIFALLCLPLYVLSYPTVGSQQVPLYAEGGSSRTSNETDPTVRPLVIWHGLGDSYMSAGMLEFANLIKEVHPGIFVHLIYVEKGLDADQRAGFFGNVDIQVSGVAEQLADIEELRNGFDAIGFSQGGQFLRAYVERYNTPPVHNLITFGSQHMGVSDLPACAPGDIRCQIARRAAKAGVYNAWAQSNLVQAQYFRDPDQLPAYFASNHFLTSINNEIAETANRTYARHLASLRNLVLVLFSEDQTVVPKESSWFGSYAPPEDKFAEPKTIVPMRLQPIYLADTFGLRTLDERGGVTLEICMGRHMQLKNDCWEPLVRRFAGGKVKGKS